MVTAITLMLIASLVAYPEYDALSHHESFNIGTVYACSPVYIRTAPDMRAPVVVTDNGEYAVVLPNDIVVYKPISSQWVHLASELGFIPAQSLDDAVCFVDKLPEWLVCLQQYATSVTAPHPDAAMIVAAYAYYSAHYRVNLSFALAQAFHESNVLRSTWAKEHANYAGLWVSGARRLTEPSSGYWVKKGSVWVAGRHFDSPAIGVMTHLMILSRYSSEQAVLARWAADPLYAQKIKTWRYQLTTRCLDTYDKP